VAGIAHVGDDDQLLLITEQGMMIRTDVRSIRIAGRKTQGVRVINIDEGDTVVGAVKVVEQAAEDSGPEDESSAASPDETSAEEPIH
jgi:DNA gyrase subunit A